MHVLRAAAWLPRGARWCQTHAARTASAPPPRPLALPEEEMLRHTAVLNDALRAAGTALPPAENWAFKPVQEAPAEGTPEGPPAAWVWRSQDVQERLKAALKQRRSAKDCVELYEALPEPLRRERWVVETIAEYASAIALPMFFRTLYASVPDAALHTAMSARALTVALQRFPARLDSKAALSDFKAFYKHLTSAPFVQTRLVSLGDRFYERIVEYLTVAGLASELKGLILALLSPYAAAVAAKEAKQARKHGAAPEAAEPALLEVPVESDVWLIRKRESRDAGRVTPQLARVIVHACVVSREGMFVAEHLLQLLHAHGRLHEHIDALFKAVAAASDDPLLKIAWHVSLPLLVVVQQRSGRFKEVPPRSLKEMVARWVSHHPAPLEAKIPQLLDYCASSRNPSLLEPLVAKLVLLGRVDTALNCCRLLGVERDTRPTHAAVGTAIAALANIEPAKAEEYMRDYVARLHAIPAGVGVAQAYLAALVSVEASKRTRVKNIKDVRTRSGDDAEEENPFRPAVALLKRVSKNPAAADVFTAAGVLSLMYSTTEYWDRPIDLLSAAQVCSPKEDLRLLKTLPYFQSAPLRTTGSRLWFDQLAHQQQATPGMAGRTLIAKVLGAVRRHVSEALALTADVHTAVLLDPATLGRLVDKYPDGLPPPKPGHVVLVPYSTLLRTMEDEVGMDWWIRGVPKGHERLQALAEAITDYPTQYVALSFATEVVLNLCIRVPITGTDNLAWAAHLPDPHYIKSVAGGGSNNIRYLEGNDGWRPRPAPGAAARPPPPVDPETLTPRRTPLLSTPHVTENLLTSLMVAVGKRRVVAARRPGAVGRVERIANENELHAGHRELPFSSFVEEVFDHARVQGVLKESFDDAWR